MKVFLDDVRNPVDCISYMYRRIGSDNPIYLQDWEVVRDYGEFTRVVKENIDAITHVSFDHDLALEHYIEEQERAYEEGTGYDCAVWMRNLYRERDIPLPTIYVHSMNPAGVENIRRVFNNGKK